MFAVGPTHPTGVRLMSSSSGCRKGLQAIRFHDLWHPSACDFIFAQGEDINLVAELLEHADPAITASIYLHPDAKMHKRAGMRQNRRVTTALAKAERGLATCWRQRQAA